MPDLIDDGTWREAALDRMQSLYSPPTPQANGGFKIAGAIIGIVCRWEVLMMKALLTTAALAMLTVPTMAAEEPLEEACRSGKKRLEAQQRLVKFYNEWWARSGADVRGQLDQVMYNVQATLAWQTENCGEPRAVSRGAKQQQAK